VNCERTRVEMLTKTQREELTDWFNGATYGLQGWDAQRIREPFFQLLREDDELPEMGHPEYRGPRSEHSSVITSVVILGVALAFLVLGFIAGRVL
jgi:hypothetical protein